jgi:hypothetical protein
MAPGARLRRGESHRRAGRSCCCSDGGQWPSEKVIGGRKGTGECGSGIGEVEAVGPPQPSCKLYFVTNSDNRPISNLDSSPKGFFLRNTPLSFSSCDSTPSRRPVFPFVLSRLAPSQAAKPRHESPILQPGRANEVTARCGHG